jgi:hypothetical protein
MVPLTKLDSKKEATTAIFIHHLVTSRHAQCLNIRQITLRDLLPIMDGMESVRAAKIMQVGEVGCFPPGHMKHQPWQKKRSMRNNTRWDKDFILLLTVLRFPVPPAPDERRVMGVSSLCYERRMLPAQVGG